jgi:hypothetical protein
MSQPAGGGSQLGPYLGVVWRLAYDKEFHDLCDKHPEELLNALKKTAAVHSEAGFAHDVYDNLEGGIAPQEDYQRLLAGGDFTQALDPECIARMFHPTPPGCPEPPPPPQ